MKIDTYSADAVFLRPKTDSAAQAGQKNSAENFAALVENASRTAEGGLQASQLLSGRSGPAGGAELLSQSTLAQLQINRLKASENSALSPEEAVKQVEETLSLLENYAIALGDPSAALKDIAPLAEELSLNAESLNTLSQGLKSGDPLKELSSETASLAAVEALKFRRGDYI